MIITTPEIDAVQAIIDSHEQTSPVFDPALSLRFELISELAKSQGIDRKALVRARLGIK